MLALVVTAVLWSRTESKTASACLEAALGSCLENNECPHNHLGNYLPKKVAIASTTEREHAKATFDNWFCGLRPRAGRLPRLERTVSKTMFLAAKETVEALSHHRRFIEILSASRSKWIWLPKDSIKCWIHKESCFNVKARESYDLVLALAYKRKSKVQPTADKTAHVLGLWRAGQVIRILSHRLGPCGQNAVNALPLVVSKKEYIATFENNRSLPYTYLDLAVHIRRGDACKRYATQETDFTIQDQARRCYPISYYAQAIRQIYRQYGTNESTLRLRVASDSPSAIIELCQHIHKEYSQLQTEVFYFEYDRINVGGHENATLGASPSDSRMYIEHRPEVNLSLAVASLYADLELLSGASFFIGTAESALSRLLLLALIGTFGAIPPFLFIDTPRYLHKRESGGIWRHAFDHWLAHPKDIRAVLQRITS